MAALQKYTVTGPAGNLEGIAHMPNDPPAAIAVIAHPLPTMGGTMEHKVVTTLAKTFVGMGHVSLRFNFRGVGESGGEFDEGGGEVEDVLAVVKYAQERFGDLPLVLAGFSFGGYVQARAAECLAPRHLVLIAPAVNRFVSSAMPEVPNHTLVIHGDKDEVIPLEEVLRWAGAYHQPIVVLPGATHFFHGRLNQLKEIVQRHFAGRPI
jgi:alpha/beta superfamily hydrolase